MLIELNETVCYQGKINSNRSESTLNENSFGIGRFVEDFINVNCPVCCGVDARYYYSRNYFDCDECGYSGKASDLYDRYKFSLELNDEPVKIETPYTDDDTGNALRFKDKYAGQLLYSFPEKFWRYYDGRRYRPDECGEVKRAADRVIMDMAKGITLFDSNIKEKMRFLAKTRSSAGKQNMIEEAKHLNGMYCSPEEFDKDPFQINVKNGTYDFLNEILLDHNSVHRLTKIAGIRFDTNAGCPLWEKTIKTVLNNDEDYIRFFKQVIGYTLTGSTREQMMFILYGTGKNGKTTVMGTIAAMMGEYALSAAPETLMINDRTGGATPEIARLKGARLVLTSESQDGAKLNEARVKALTGGDTIVARQLYQSEIEFKPQFKLFLFSNHKPVIDGTDEGIWRRICLLPFTVKISDEELDLDLQRKLIGEYSGILNWAIQGFRDYKKNGFLIPNVVIGATESYRSDSDIFMQFWDECVCEDTGSTISAAELYTCYRLWCSENGMKSFLNQIRFGREANRITPSERSSIGKRYPHLSLSDYGKTLACDST